MGRHRGEAGTRVSLGEICIGNAARLRTEDRHTVTMRDHTGQDISEGSKILSSHVLK